MPNSNIENNNFNAITNAIFNKNKTYRYRLWRFNKLGNAILYIMLNPSSAGENKNDNTITKLCGFTSRLQFDGFIVCNLCARISTDPSNIKRDEYLTSIDMKIISNTLKLQCVKQVIYAWGQNFNQKDKIVLLNKLLDEHGFRPYCLSICKNNVPRHPLMLSYNSILRPYFNSYDKHTKFKETYNKQKKLHNMLKPNVNYDKFYISVNTIEKYKISEVETKKVLNKLDRKIVEI